ncbi:hypothetical protein ACHAWO_010100 [Cyclotella atomus]|uniref:MYND-type domain-containing protein n=1 Tax=Cyclotella atomus TaxID=382360 RepID=A0ABD3QQP1_9STRA
MSTSVADNEIKEPKSCANCGQEETDDAKLKGCAACKLVKYCSRDCQVSHRSRHKKACNKRTAELHEEALFRQPPRREDCPICFRMLPEGDTGGGQTYWTCCGKTVCSRCCYEHIQVTGEDAVCPFCRSPATERILERLNSRIKFNDAEAYFELGLIYFNGEEKLEGVARDPEKGLQLLIRGGELGAANSYSLLANAYMIGDGVEKDEKKARHYHELAAIGGSVKSNLAMLEVDAGNFDKAIKHAMIGAEFGDPNSLKLVQLCFMNTNGEFATRDQYETALRAYQQYIEEVRSESRDKAAVIGDQYKYLIEPKKPIEKSER